MVLPKSNSKRARKERRSRDSRTSGTQSDTSSKKEEVPSKVPEEKIRVGEEFQAILPEVIPLNERKLDFEPEKAVPVWSPTNDTSDDKLGEYIDLAKKQYNFNEEQALGMLFWHKHRLERAVPDLANFTPFSAKSRSTTELDKILLKEDLLYG